MAGNEFYVFSALAVIGAIIALRYWRQASKRELLADNRGLEYIERGLSHLPSDFMQTVLFTLADGGHESHVATGQVDIAGHSIAHSVFDLRFQRDVRGEWAYLTTRPSFRLRSPTTVLTYTVDQELPHTIIKRRGPSLIVAESDVEAFTSMPGIARDVLGIERAMQVEPPNGIGRDALVFEQLGDEYFVWSADPDAARTILDSQTQQLLMSPAAGDRDLTIELYGPLLILYCASDGRLAHDDVLAASSFGDALCARIVAHDAATEST